MEQLNNYSSSRFWKKLTMLQINGDDTNQIQYHNLDIFTIRQAVIETNILLSENPQVGRPRLKPGLMISREPADCDSGLAKEAVYPWLLNLRDTFVK